MGALFFFDEEVTANDNKGNRSKCQVDVVDNHGVPEVKIGPVGAAYTDSITEFDNKEQFEKFVDAVNGLPQRLYSKN